MLGAILLLSAGLRLYRLDQPGEYYFDEVYFGYTAKQYLAGNRDAYNPWAHAAPGCANEWSHPPTGKLVIAGGMALAGQGDFGMRLSSVVFGLAAVALVFLLAVALFDAPVAGLFAAGLFSMEGLAFVHSRIATADAQLVAFMLAGMVSWVWWRRSPRHPVWALLGAGLACGLMVSTKWTGLYLLALLGGDFVLSWLWRPWNWRLETVLAVFVCLVLVPAEVYLASYIHYSRSGYDGGNFVELHRQMWGYHMGLKEHHPYESRPWQWVLNLRPVWFYVARNPDKDTVANIYNLGNSVVLYFGAASVAGLVGLLVVSPGVELVRRLRSLARGFAGWVRGRGSATEVWAGLNAPIQPAPLAWSMAFLVAGYLIVWLPWQFSPRIMFFYHYLPAVPMLCVAGGVILADWATSRWALLRAMAWLVVTLAVAWFALFFPNMTGIDMPTKWVDKVYHCVRSWV